MKDGIIELDTKQANVFGFTSDKFTGLSYLWKKGSEIIISAIESKKKGNFEQLVKKIKDKGYTVVVPTPMGKMVDIVKKNGYKQSFEGDVELWRL